MLNLCVIWGTEVLGLMQGTISVLKIDSSGETDSYVMFNGKTGANDQVPQNGDEVVIVEQSIELGGSASS
jgi:hypothetical protein